MYAAYGPDVVLFGLNIIRNEKPELPYVGLKNNDGRTECFICKSQTKSVGVGLYNVCKNIECEWFNN